MTSKNSLDAQQARIDFAAKLAEIPDAPPERLAQLGLSLPTPAGAAVDQVLAKARERGKVRSTKLPPRLDRGRPRLRVEGEQLDEKKARAARVLTEALGLPGVPALLACGFTKGDLRVLFTTLRRAAEAGGTCDWPVDKIACMAGVSRATVTRALAKLNAAAHLVVTWRERTGRKHETSLVRCGISDLAGKVWARLTVRRSAVDACGRAALAEKRKDLARRANLDTSKVSGEPDHSFDVYLAAGQNVEKGSGVRSAHGSLNTGRTSPAAPSEVKMLSGGRVWQVPSYDHKRGVSTIVPDWVPYADPEASRWGERVAPYDLDPVDLVPADGALTPLQAALRKAVELMAEKREKGQQG
jgi:hypothetical protein